jgi:Cysteine-rich secretory protein family
MYNASDMDVLSRQFSVKVKEAHMRKRLKFDSIAQATALAAALFCAPCTHARVAADYSTREGDAPVLSKSEFENQILAAHNIERARIGSPPLVWNAKLAADAEKWAKYLATSDSFEHDDKTDQGENLWMGDSAAYTPDEMVGLWISERKLFKPGIFPEVSRSADWTDVGHYTQLIWPSTRHVGCATAHNNDNDYLVCRYDPSGNVIGISLSQAR